LQLTSLLRASRRPKANAVSGKAGCSAERSFVNLRFALHSDAQDTLATAFRRGKVTLRNWKGSVHHHFAGAFPFSGSLPDRRTLPRACTRREKVGQRTTLDVLNAELEYLGSQIQLVITAKRDRVVAEDSVYASIGRLDAQSLGLSVPYYDPFEQYDTVENKWFGLKPPPPPAPNELMGSRG
jgi:hypothetical protein